MLTPRAVLEITNLSDDGLKAARAGRTSESNAILAKISTIKSTGQSSDETRAQYADALKTEAEVAAGHFTVSQERHRQLFFRYLLYGDGERVFNETERRDLLAGQQTIAYTGGTVGGYLVPIQYESMLFTALAQSDDLLSASACHFTVEDSPTLQPKQLSGYDLSTIEAAQVGETVQQKAGSFPNVLGRVLRGNIIYKLSIAASLEAEQDIPGVMSKFSIAYGIGLARKLGADAVNGNGTSQPQGLLTAIASSYSTSSGKITNADIRSIVSSVNYIYRRSALCAWAMSSTVLERIRLATDNQNRPLIHVNDENGETRLAGFPIRICPSLVELVPSLGLNSSIVFGDFSHFHIRCSKPTVQRTINSDSGDILRGEALYVARIRMDSAVFDPSSGNAPPLIVATVTD